MNTMIEQSQDNKILYENGKYTCHYCDYSTEYKNKFNRHLQTKKHNKNKDNTGTKSTQQDKYNCECCQYSTKQKAHYTRHLNSKKHLKNLNKQKTETETETKTENNINYKICENQDNNQDNNNELNNEDFHEKLFYLYTRNMVIGLFNKYKKEHISQLPQTINTHCVCNASFTTTNECISHKRECIIYKKINEINKLTCNLLHKCLLFTINKLYYNDEEHFHQYMEIYKQFIIDTFKSESLFRLEFIFKRIHLFLEEHEFSFDEYFRYTFDKIL